MRRPGAIAIVAALAIGACRAGAGPARDGAAGVAPVASTMEGTVLANRFAYIPAQCYTITRDATAAAVHNPCYACHQHSTPPNFVDDADLQLSYDLPGGALANPWRNLFAPPVTAAPRAPPDAEVLARVRASNYFDASGAIALARALAALPAAWDGEHDGRWNGYVPDAWFRFDDRGFDHAPDGRPTGWRSFAYAPFVGTFFPTNGSADDVLIRLDPSLQEDASGHFSLAVYEANLAIVEALIKRAGGGGTPMHFVGRARAHEADGTFPIEPGLFPMGTEFLHSVRYLDVGPGGEVTMAARMKELRYAKKVRWFSPADLKAHAAGEAVEQSESADGFIEHVWQHDRGIYNGQGWLLQGFIEAADGSLRPQSYEETVPCAGCHGGVGATTDSVFSFPRKLGASAPARGWFHWSQHGLAGLPEPRRRDGRYEYTFYLEQNGAGDDLRENEEVRARFFDPNGHLRPDRAAALHTDIATLLLPSPARAIALDRAYLAIVAAQAFTGGRDVVLAPARNVYRHAPADRKTGVKVAVAGPAEEAKVAAVAHSN